MKYWRKLLIVLIALCLLTPLGLLIPAHFGVGAAWGEWSPDELQGLVGFVPDQLARLSAIWTAPMPNYNLPGHEDAGIGRQSGSYVISALAGIAIVCLLSLGVGKALRKKEETDAS